MGVNLFGGATRIIVILVALGMLVILASGVNSISAATANRMDARTTYLEKLWTFDLGIYMEKQTTELQGWTELYWDRISLIKAIRWTLFGLGAFVLAALCICPVVIVMVRFFKRLNPPPVYIQTYSPWDDERFRRTMIAQARLQEQMAIIIENAADQYKHYSFPVRITAKTS